MLYALEGMARAVLKIKLIEEEGGKVYLPSTFDTLEAYDMLQFGQLRKKAIFIKRDDAKPIIYVSISLAKDLCLISDINVSFTLLKRLIKLGPVFGILQKNDPRNASEEKKKSLTKFLEGASKAKIMAYIFLLQSINFKEKTTLAFILKNGEFIETKMPLPDVIYDRLIPTSKDFGKPLKEDKRQKLLSNLKIAKINDDQIIALARDKCLFANFALKNNIPHPKTLPLNKNNLEKMIRHFDKLYFKPVFGALGSGIVIARKNKKNNFDLFYRRYRRGVWADAFIYNIKKEDLLSKVKETRNSFGLSQCRYLVQSELDLYLYQNRQTDLRVVMQRGSGGKLKITGVVARIGGNLAQNGDVESLDNVLADLELRLALKPNTLKKKLHSFVFRVWELLEKETGEKIGELGMDVGLGDDGSFWLIEVNARLGRKVFERLRGITLDKKLQREILKKEEEVFLAPSLYAKYLAGF